jgi:hypothetical protein
LLRARDERLWWPARVGPTQDRDRCLDIVKLFDTFSIKHIPREENSKANRLAQQASGYIVTQGFFWVASVNLVENIYELRSKGKLMLDNVDQL